MPLSHDNPKYRGPLFTHRYKTEEEASMHAYMYVYYNRRPKTGGLSLLDIITLGSARLKGRGPAQQHVAAVEHPV